jgi:hypothetical protein
MTHTGRGLAESQIQPIVKPTSFRHNPRIRFEGRADSHNKSKEQHTRGEIEKIDDVTPLTSGEIIIESHDLYHASRWPLTERLPSIMVGVLGKADSILDEHDG